MPPTYEAGHLCAAGCAGVCCYSCSSGPGQSELFGHFNLVLTHKPVTLFLCMSCTGTVLGLYWDGFSWMLDGSCSVVSLGYLRLGLQAASVCERCLEVTVRSFQVTRSSDCAVLLSRGGSNRQRSTDSLLLCCRTCHQHRDTAHSQQSTVFDIYVPDWDQFPTGGSGLAARPRLPA